MQSHLLHMCVFTALVSTFFAFLVRHDARSRWRFGLAMAACMLVLSIALGWMMYALPR